MSDLNLITFTIENRTTMRSGDTEILLPPLSDFLRVLESTSSREERHFLEVMFHALASEAEVRELKWGDIDDDNLQIKIGSNGWKPMTDKLVDSLSGDWLDILFDYPDELSEAMLGLDQFVFEREGARAPFTNPESDMLKLCTRAGVAYFSMSAIKPLAVWTLATNGVSLHDIKWLLGHDDVSPTKKFVSRLKVNGHPFDLISL